MENNSDKNVSDIPRKETEKVVVKENKFTAQKIKILASVIYGNFLIGSGYALMSPFFPAEAEKKLASPTSYGLVFGAYQLTMLLVSPIYGKIMPRLKPGFMMKSGMFVAGVSALLFGFLDKAPAGPTFIAAAATIRCVNALGASSYFTASLTSLVLELPDVFGRAMALSEAAYAFGLAGGPALGGFLYQIGGFYLPFTVMGSLLLAGMIMTIFLFPQDDKEITTKPINVFKLLTDLDFLICSFAICACSASVCFNDVSLEPHLRQFHVTPATTGAIFLLAGITDAVFSPLLGYIFEKVSHSQCIIFLGSLLLTACFLLVGPASFLNFETTLWVVVFCQFFLGLGMAAIYVCSVADVLKNAVVRGFPDEVGTYSMISGTLMSFACIGAFIGPSLGGFLIDNIGYIHSTEVVVLMQIVVAVTCASRFLYLCSRKGNMKEKKNDA